MISVIVQVIPCLEKAIEMGVKPRMLDDPHATKMSVLPSREAGLWIFCTCRICKLELPKPHFCRDVLFVGKRRPRLCLLSLCG